MPRPFTPADDLYIRRHYSTQTLQQIGAALTRRWQSIQQRVNRLIAAGQLVRRHRAYQPPWTEAELAYLRAHWGRTPEAEIAAHLGRSDVACLLKARRLGIYRKQAFLSAREVARVLGVDDHAVLGWITAGHLAGQKSVVRVGANWAWAVEPEALTRFLAEHPRRYDRTRIDGARHAYWRGIADQVALRLGDARPPKYRVPWTEAEDRLLDRHWGREAARITAQRIGRTVPACECRAGKISRNRRDAGPWLTASAAARQLGIAPQRLLYAIRHGYLPAVKTPFGAAAYRFWAITPAALARFQAQGLPMDRIHRRAQERRNAAARREEPLAFPTEPEAALLEAA